MFLLQLLISQWYPYCENLFVYCSAYRTPLCKAKKGGFKDTYPDDILAAVLKVGYTKLSCGLMSKIIKDIYLYSFFTSSLQAVIEKTNVNPSEVGDIVVGSVLAPGSQRASECRMAAFYAGFPGRWFFNFRHLFMRFLFQDAKFSFS